MAGVSTKGTASNSRIDVSGTAIKIGSAIGSGASAVALGTIKNLSFLLIILGLLHFLLKFLLPPTLQIISSLVLFIIAGYALAERVQKDRLTIMIPMLAFLLWFFAFNGNFEPRFLLFFLSIVGAILILAGVLTKGEAIKPELLGFFPVLFLFLDIGLIEFLILELSLPITPILQNVILYVPWWFFFGIFTLPSQSSENTATNMFINLLKLLGVIFLVFVVFAPLFPNIGYDESIKLPQAEELLSAQEQLRGRLPKGENLLFSNIMCLGDITGGFQECINLRQQVASLKEICKERNLEGSELDNCVLQEKEKIKEAEFKADGTTDISFKEVTKAEFIISNDFFPKLTYRQKDEDLKIDYPATLKLENPRNIENFQVEISCEFKKGSETIQGKINLGGEDKSTISSVGEKEELPVICTPTKNLDGIYKLNYQARLLNIKTISSLKRAFLGEKTFREKEELISQLKKDVFSSPSDILSKSPDEFARLNFAFGKTANNPYISNGDSIILAASIVNTGLGKVEKIKSYHLDLAEKGVIVKGVDGSCIEGSQIVVPEKLSSRQPYILPTCFLELSSELTEFSDLFKVRTFFGELVYDYNLKREISVEVKVSDVGELIS